MYKFWCRGRFVASRVDSANGTVRPPAFTFSSQDYSFVREDPIVVVVSRGTFRFDLKKNMVAFYAFSSSLRFLALLLVLVASIDRRSYGVLGASTSLAYGSDGGDEHVGEDGSLLPQRVKRDTSPVLRCAKNEVLLAKHNLCVHVSIYNELKTYPAAFSYTRASDQPNYEIAANADDDSYLDLRSVSEVYTIRCPRAYRVTKGTTVCNYVGYVDGGGSDADDNVGLRGNSKDDKPKRVVCYYTNWTRYHAKFFPANVPTDICTHPIYAFFPINDQGQIRLSDSWADNGVHGISDFIGLKGRGVVERVMFSVGGWTYSGPNFGVWYDLDDSANVPNYNKKAYQDIWHLMLTSQASRKVFIDSVNVMNEKFGFDGIEIDFEYPSCPQNVCDQRYVKDAENFVLLLRELKQALPFMYLSVAASANYWDILPNTYDVGEVGLVVDNVSVMTYDYNVYSPGSNVGELLDKSKARAGIDYYVNKMGVDPKKIVLGLSMYGRGYQIDPSLVVANRDVNEPKNINYSTIPSLGPSRPFRYTQAPAVGSLLELCSLDDRIEQSYVQDDGSWLFFIEGGDGYMFSYADKADLKSYRRMYEDYKLAGFLFYAIDQEDFHGICKLPGGAFPFVRAVLTGNNLDGPNFLSAKISSGSSSSAASSLAASSVVVPSSSSSSVS